LNKTTSKIISGFKYVYLIAIFALLSGFFHPLITDTNFDNVITGVIILLIGLAGGVLLFKAATSNKRKTIYLGGGFVLFAISLFYVIQITGRS
jgi:peptidoglycan/LPS O-acetylase OafA/YrhL